jgi:hypothetical protein
MEVEALPLFGFNQRLHLGALLGAVVIHDEMHFLIGQVRSV